MKKKKIFTWLQYVLFFGAGLFLVWWQLRSMNAAQKEDFLISLKQANYLYIIPIVFINLLSHFIRAIRWKLLMEPINYFPKTKNVFSAVMVGYLANSAVPRLGEVLKCTILAKYEKLKVDKLVGTILVERTIDLLCFILFVSITILTQYQKLETFVTGQFSQVNSTHKNNGLTKLTIGVLVVIILFLALRQLIKSFPENKIVLWFRNFVAGIGQGFLTVIRLQKKKTFLLYTILIWSLYLIQIYIGFFALTKTAHLGIGAACSVLSLVTVAMIITPGGIGTFPIFVMQVLLIYGVSHSTGQAFGWMMWGVTTAIIVVVGFICLLLLPYFNREKDNIAYLE